MNITELSHQIQSKKSMLCVGLDTSMDKLPKGFSKDLQGMLAFNKEIIAATQDYAVAYKINIAFYEALGKGGWDLLESTRALLPQDCFNIADAKRGDIGNTSTMYATAFFNHLDFDSITVAPYMGYDSVEPFLAFKDKVTIVLGLTSNKGSEDFQTNPLYTPPLYETVIQKISSWGSPEQLMFVIGATKAEKLKEIRAMVPDHFLLIPGVGAQGGSADDVCAYGANKRGGLLINSSRGILYASGGEDFAEKARMEAKIIAEQTAHYI
ncbi:MAG: orotidine-5'-phosphate decarboxylase [Bacteroidia bacterium]